MEENPQINNPVSDLVIPTRKHFSVKHFLIGLVIAIIVIVAILYIWGGLVKL